MPELTNVRSIAINGALRFKDTQGQDLFVIGATTGVPFGSYYQVVSTAGATITLTAANCGKLITTTTDQCVVTLPSAAIMGLSYTIQNTASDGGALLAIVTPATTDVIQGYGSAATTNCGMRNTKSTQRYGDSVGLLSSGSVTWFVTNVIGTWVTASTS